MHISKRKSAIKTSKTTKEVMKQGRKNANSENKYFEKKECNKNVNNRKVSYEARKKEWEPRKKDLKYETFKHRKKDGHFNAESHTEFDKWLENTMEETRKHGWAVI